jgi:uncharacterized membrane protein (DUF4010 family)
MNETTRTLFEQLGIALGLGLLVGIQRQFAESMLAGVRTFPIVTVLGTLTAQVDRELESHGWLVAASLAGLAIIVGFEKSRILRQPRPDFGLTTEAALLLMFVLGAYLVSGERIVAVAVGAGVAVLLQFKAELHGIVARLGAEDLRAIMTFALMSCIVLPLLPDRNYGPFAVLNPYQIWLMVVLIVGVSLTGYIIYKFFGRTAGIVLGGILGGAISSTATSVSYARRCTGAPETVRLATVVIAIASAMVYVRVIIEIAVVAPLQFAQLAPPILVVLLASVLGAATAWWQSRRHQTEMPEHSNPTELKSAVVFAAVYAAVLLALASAKHYLGGGGLYAVAVLSGLTDMDAITISTSRLVGLGDGQGISITDGWRLILVASLSNLVFKLGIVGVIGRWTLFRRTATVFALPLVVIVVVLILWPSLPGS